VRVQLGVSSTRLQLELNQFPNIEFDRPVSMPSIESLSVSSEFSSSAANRESSSSSEASASSARSSKFASASNTEMVGGYASNSTLGFRTPATLVVLSAIVSLDSAESTDVQKFRSKWTVAV